jgi:hypothetical protein
LDADFAVYLRGVAYSAPAITCLFSGFQKLVHLFEGDMTPAAFILCTLYKGYQISLEEARTSSHINEEMVKLLFRHIFARFLNEKEGNLYRLLALATPEGRMFYRSRFMADTKEFLEEPDCGHPLGLRVEVEAKTREAINFANARATKISAIFREARAHLNAIARAIEGSDISASDCNVESTDEITTDAEFPDDDQEDILQDEENDDEFDESEDEAHRDVDEGEDDRDPSSCHATECSEAGCDTLRDEFGIFRQDSLDHVKQELVSLCRDLARNPLAVTAVWDIWIGGCFQMDVINSFAYHSPVEVWKGICTCSMFSPLLDILMRLFAIPASQAVCERALWHLRRILLPFSLKTSPALALAKLQGVITFDYGNPSDYRNDVFHYGPND